MNKLILKLLFASLAITMFLVSCNSKPTLQSYYLEHQDKPGFYAQSIPKGILGIDASDLSADAQTGYESINKVNVLFYPLKDKNTTTFKAESKKLDAILQNETYKTLISHKDDGTKYRMLYDGSQDAIDEVVIFGTDENMGLGVARILGDDMSMTHIMKLFQEMDKANVDGNIIKNIMKNFAGKNKEFAADL